MIAQRYQLTPYGAPRLDTHAVTPAEQLRAQQLLDAYIQIVTNSGQLRGRYIQSGVAIPAGGLPGPDPGSAA